MQRRLLERVCDCDQARFAERTSRERYAEWGRLRNETGRERRILRRYRSKSTRDHDAGVAGLGGSGSPPVSREEDRVEVIVGSSDAVGAVVDRVQPAARQLKIFLPILLMRKFMRLTGMKAESENNINVSALNGILGRLFGAESWILRRMNLPFGVSGLCVAKVRD